jgi:hypothetical protein
MNVSNIKNWILTLGVTILVVCTFFLIPVGFAPSGVISLEASAQNPGAPGTDELGNPIPEPPANNGTGYSQASGGETSNCGLNPFCYLEKIAAQFLALLLLSLGGFLLWFGGMFLDLAIEHLVLGMGTWFTQGGIGQVVNSVWSIVRDVVNLVFIFGFVYIGISTILGIGPGWRKMLAQLVIAALLVNFSLFFVKIIVDIANVAAIEVNELMDENGDGNVAASFATAMGIQTFYNQDKVTEDALAGLNGPGTALTFVIMAFIFLAITGITFAAAAIMIVVRFVALIFIMIASPLYFAALGFPQLAKFTSKLNLGMVLGYAFYPVVFLFLIYVSLRVLDTTTFSGQGHQLANLLLGTGAQPTDENAFMIILQFAVAIVLVILSLRAAKYLSMYGANAVVGFTEDRFKAAGKYAAGVPFGLAAAASRGTVGRAALKATKNEDLKEAASRKGIGGFIARRKLDVARAGASASFDARNVGGMGKKLGIGEGGKGGFKERREAIEKSRIKFGESLGEVKDSDPKVKAWQDRIDAEEGAIEDLKSLISEAQDPTRKKELQGQLRYREFSLRNSQEALKYEKNRRQIGSADANNVMANMSPYVRQQLAQQFIEVSTARTAAEKAAARNTLRTMIANTREYQKKNAAPLGQRGYAGVLESSGILNVIREGHLAPAGEALRKKYEKKFRQSKEDERADRMIDTLKANKS